MSRNLNIRAPATERTWVLLVLLLSMPAILFALLRMIYVPGTLPEFVDLALVWTMTLTGMLGCGPSLGAFVASFAATIQPNVAARTKLFLWLVVALSFMSCVQSSSVSP